MRAEHRAASVGEPGMKDGLYAADATSSGSARTQEFMRVHGACDSCMFVDHMTSALQLRGAFK